MVPSKPLSDYDFLQLLIFYTTWYIIHQCMSYIFYNIPIMSFPHISLNVYLSPIRTIFSHYSQFITRASFSWSHCVYMSLSLLHYSLNILPFAPNLYMSLPLTIFSCRWQNFGRPLIFQLPTIVSILLYIYIYIYIYPNPTNYQDDKLSWRFYT